MTELIECLNKIANDCSTGSQDSGTHEGAVKAAETRRAHGGHSQSREQVDALAKHNALQKANWEEMQSGIRMDAGKENPYKYARAINKTDALLGKPRTDSGARFYSGSNGFGAPDGAKMHNAGQKGAMAAIREVNAQRNALGANRADETPKVGGGGFTPQPTTRPWQGFKMEHVATMAKHDPTVAKSHLAEVLGQNKDLARVYRYPNRQDYERLVSTKSNRDRLRELGYL